jgi:cobaltochelatase CobS
MASINTIKTLSTLDKFVINGAVSALKAPDHIRQAKDKMERLNWLGDLIEQGLTDFNYIKNCSPVADNVSSVDTAKLDATASVATRAEAVALDAINKVTVVAQSISAVAQQMNDLSVAVHNASVASKSNLDEDKINAEVASAIAKAFKPFAQAVKDAKAEAVVANATKAKIIDRKSALDVFGVDVRNPKGDPVMVDIWDAPDSPDVDPNFVWQEGILKHLLLSQKTGENLWFGGAKGTGKSETARQFASRTGRSYTRINFHKYTTADDYAGAVGLENGATVFKKGAFLEAFTSPSTVILLDEISMADAGELATLNGFLEPNSAVNYGGFVHRRAEGVLVFSADNTLTNGDTSGRYAKTQNMNSALVDRFARVIEFKYLSKEQEVIALTLHTGCHKMLAEHVVNAINACRAKVHTGDVIDAPSIRSALAFIRALDILSVDEAWESTITSRQPEESRTALDAIKSAYINASVLAKYL